MRDKFNIHVSKKYVDTNKFSFGTQVRLKRSRKSVR